MNDNEFLCAELGMIEYADIDAYSPSDFQKKYLGMLDEGVKNHDYRLRMLLLELASKNNMVPREEDGTAIEDQTLLFSPDHIQMIIQIRNAQIHGLGQRKTSEDELQKILCPAFELVKNQKNKDEEFYIADLNRRWEVAGNACNWEGVIKAHDRKIALTSSPIWKMLGSGDLFDDGLDIDHPPFYINGGWIFGWRRITKKELEALSVKSGPLQFHS